MNGVAGLALTRPVASKIQELARPADGGDEHTMDRRRLEGPDAWDGLKAWREAQVPAKQDRYGRRYVPVRTWTRGPPTSTRLQMEAEV